MSKKILIVDDDLFLRELYQEVFQNAGYEVEVASDGKEGYDKISSNAYDAILLDVMLPQLDGLGILTKLKESQSNFSFNKIILLTNLGKDEAVKQAGSYGVFNTITKSEINPDQLLDQVKQLFGEVAEKPTTAKAA